NESDSNSESSQIDNTEEFDEIEQDELMTSNTIRRGVFNFDPTELATDLVKEWDYENYEDSDSLNSVDKVDRDISENLNYTEGENSALENLPIALRKT
ncbi:36716_t:CDS:1, partial [Racocetra persica]